jgi:tol-pal system protein YbgF
MRLVNASRAALVAGLLFAYVGAQAALFEDEDARKAIVDLRARVVTLEEQSKARGAESAAATAQLTEQVVAMRRSLLDLNNQLEAMRGEVAKLRGSDEQLARDLADMQKRQKDVGQALDERMRVIEPVKVTLDGRDFLVAPLEKRAYDDAMVALRAGDFDQAVALLSNFQRRYDGGPYSDSARFWYGNALYGRRDYKEAISVLRGFVAAAPTHPRAPEALLAVANSQAEIKDVRGARKTIDELLKTYPQSEAALAGKERLASFK